MRYLPTINVEDGIEQFAFPDIHAIALVECSWISEEATRGEHLKQLLLRSPMLLAWTALHGSDHRFTSTNLEDFIDTLTRFVDQQAHLLYRDHAKPLTSVHRVEAATLVDVHCFFSLLENGSNQESLEIQLLQRLQLIEFELRTKAIPQLDLGIPAELKALFGSESLLAKFQNTDLRDSKLRETTLAEWNLELPFFKNELGQIESRLARLELLEQKFSTELEKEKIAAMRQLAYGASHEVNNPLANISTRAQALLRDETDPKRRQRLQTIDAQAFRAHDMISDLMTFARPPRPRFERHQLFTIVEEALSKLTRQGFSQNTEFSNEVERGHYFDVDRSQLIDILLALLRNSLEALKEGGKIRVVSKYFEERDRMQISVRDNGPGIPPEIRRHVFDPFFSGREAGRGLGFGLPKVWSLMQQHSGRVEIVGEAGATQIDLHFPATQQSTSVMKVDQSA